MQFAVVHERTPGDLLGVTLHPSFDMAKHFAWAMSFEGESTGLGVQVEVFDAAGNEVGFQCGDQVWRCHEVTSP